MQPILYSFRRCPYAIRARLALQLANIDYELRNILLKDKPLDMLQKSPKGMVPVLVLEDKVIDESLDIMLWALKQNDPLNLLNNLEQSLNIIKINDTDFKFNLDRYKYPNRYDDSNIDWQKEASKFVSYLETLLTENKFLLSNKPTLADYAIFPFIRQFTMPDVKYFESSYPKTANWLNYMVNTEEFKKEITKKPIYEE